jgi:GNAT superfamily N-acetyltransferase
MSDLRAYYMVTIYHLEMLTPEALRPAAPPRIDCMFMRAEIPIPELNRFLYVTAGRDWEWTDRLAWRDEEWDHFVRDPGVETWLLLARGTIAGYVELVTQRGQGCELRSLALLPPFYGNGLGGYLVTESIRRGFTRAGEDSRVWLHTCTLDHPVALQNYLARGLRIYREEHIPRRS